MIAAGHMTKDLAKLSSWGQFVPGALADPEGAATAHAIGDGARDAPVALLPLAVVAPIGLVLLATATAFALREARRADARVAHRAAPAILGLAEITRLHVAAEDPHPNAIVGQIRA